MGETAIEWTDCVWNPVTGCTKVSQGCKNCYAERIFHRPYPGRKFTDVRTHADRLEQPLRWRKPRRIFVNSMSDLFHEDIPFEFIDQVFVVMALADRHTFQVLTKRPERMLAYLSEPGVVARWSTQALASPRRPGYFGGLSDEWWPRFARHIWLGVSVENQETADERIPLLLQTPAAVRFLSCEPLLSAIDLTSVQWPNKGGHRVDVLRRGYWNAHGYRYGGPSADLGAARGGFTNHSDMVGVDWVIAGGESGPKARPAHPDWFRSLRAQCQAAGVPFFFKQWGEWLPLDHQGHADPTEQQRHIWPDGREYDGERETYTLNCAQVSRVGKTVAGRMLDGREWNEMPS